MKPNPTISAVILTKNEEGYIAECIESVKWTDEVIVFDSGSTDQTVEIVKELGAKVITHPFYDFASQRNAAIEAIGTEWVLFVDADERVSSELVTEISSTVHSSQYNGYWIPRHNYQLGRLIQHAGLYPDHQLRLFRKGLGYYDPAQAVHERLVLQGPAGYLIYPLIHISCETWADFIEHQKHYAQMKAEAHFARGIKPSYHFVIGPVLEFLRRYIYLQGFRDGWHGLYLSYIFAHYYFVMFVKLKELWKNHP